MAQMQRVGNVGIIVVGSIIGIAALFAILAVTGYLPLNMAVHFEIDSIIVPSHGVSFLSLGILGIGTLAGVWVAVKARKKELARH